MIKDKSRKLLAGMVLASLFGAAPAFAGAFGMYSMGSPESLSLGGATAGRDDLPANAWYNPAALGGIKSPMLQMNGVMVGLSSNYHGTNGLETRNESGDLVVCPSMFYVHPIAESPWRFSLSLFSPYGFECHWSEGDRLAPMSPVDTSIKNIYLSPTLSYDVNDQLTLAAGVSGILGQTKMSVTTDGVGSPLFEYDSWGLGYAWHLAAFYKLNDQWSAGIKYQSSALMRYEGPTSGPGTLNSGGIMHLRLPQSVTAGIAYKPTTDWTLSADVVWTGWSSVKDLTLDLDRGSLPPANDTLSMRKEWNDVFSYRFGAEYKLDRNWRLRCGYAFDNGPIPTDTRSPDLPVGDLHEFSLGFGYEADKWGIDVGYAYFLYQRAEDMYGANYDSNIHFLSLGFKYVF
jgi:long-chain fatty acid transport protein